MVISVNCNWGKVLDVVWNDEVLYSTEASGLEELHFAKTTDSKFRFVLFITQVK